MYIVYSTIDIAQYIAIVHKIIGRKLDNIFLSLDLYVAL